MANKKTGRNSLCPCGSGKKYKKCCLIRNTYQAQRRSVPQEMLKVIREHMHAEQKRLDIFGEVRPVIQMDFHEHKMVAVGNQIHYSKKWKTFPDFLIYYIKFVLGKEWIKAELERPIKERHEIMKWYDAICLFQMMQKKESDGLYNAIPNGAMHAFLLLSYDLYILRHHSSLQEALIRRLKHTEQFQGARHELFATATCIRAGYDIAFEDESDVSRKHPEFIAIHKTTGQHIAVEAKSRHRPGVLGYQGTINTEVRASINSLL